ncbi:MAG: ribosome-associated translation inhibitor RaiA [Eubacteriales bacterium]
MKLNISGKQMTVRESLKELTRKKLLKYDRFFGDSAEAYVNYSVKHGEQTVELTINSSGTLFRAEESDTTFQNALDRAMDALERQIRKNKTRLEKRMRPTAFDSLPEAFDSLPHEAEAEEEPELYIRTKTYPFKPMSVEEAILQMNLLGHYFFIFVNAETNQTCVVYQRKEGGYGLIRPE